jgi:hypothetical protein
MTWTSDPQRMAEAIDYSLKIGVQAGANHYKSKVVERLMQGYTTGAFSHGGAGVAGGVYALEPVKDAAGWVSMVGVSTTSWPYALFWEVGHINIFIRSGPGASTLLRGGARVAGPDHGVTGTYQRVEVWRPILVEQAAAIQRVIQEKFETTLTALAGGGGRAAKGLPV